MCRRWLKWREFFTSIDPFESELELPTTPSLPRTIFPLERSCAYKSPQPEKATAVVPGLLRRRVGALDVTIPSRNAGQELETAKQNAERFKNQANIAAEFLALARTERQLGRRSLIDVLAGETALINTLSGAASVEADVAIATFKGLSIMGRLNIESVGR